MYGVFKFEVVYHRPGFTKIHVEELAPLRPFKHNEYDRFLVQAYPYCTGIFSTMGGFVIFSVALLYSKF